MGNKLVYGKEDKGQMNPDLLTSLYENSKRDHSQQQMAVCLASLSEMAHNGNVAAERKSGSANTVTSQVKNKLRHKLEKRLHIRERNSKDDIMKQLQLLESLDHPDDDTDWLEMRVWLVKCLQTNLQDVDIELPVVDRVENPRTRLRRQKALEGSNLLTVRSLDSSGTGAGSSFESAS